MRLGLGLGLGVKSGGAGSPYLDGVIDSACCDVDATIEDSYGGSGQTLANLIASPADGGSQTDYDFWLGTDGTSSSTDPTFTGSAGDQAAYFNLDGGDYFSLKDTAGNVLQNLHKTSGAGSGPMWFGMAFQLGSTGLATFFGNAGGGGQVGIRGLSNDTNLRFIQFDGAGGSYNQVIAPDATWSATTNYLMLITLDSTNAGSEKYWINSTTGTDWGVAYSPQTVTADPTNPFTFGSQNGNFSMPNNSRIYGFYAGNELLDDTGAAAIFSFLETRHNRDYTP